MSYTVSAARPRLLLTPAILARLRASAAANEPRWLALKTTCDSYMGNTSPYQAGIVNYALVYAVSGIAAYGDKAIQLATLYYVNLGMSALFQQQNSPHGLSAGEVLLETAVCYDLCHDRFRGEERARFQAALEQWAEWVWPESNPDPARDTGYAINQPGDNFFHRFMMSWLAGLALHGDSQRAQEFIDVARNRWLTQVRPYLERYAPGGYLLEGTHYGSGSLARIWTYLLAHLTATGEDLIAEAAIWQSTILARLHLTTPDLRRIYPGGDQPNNSGAYLNDQARMGLLAVGSYFPEGFARFWLDNITPALNQDRLHRWSDFLFYWSDIPAHDYRTVLPTGYQDPGAGLAVARSDWNDTATMLVFRCGPNREAHGDLAAGTFMLWAGNDWLVSTARLKGGFGLLRGAPHNNCLTVGGRVQPEPRAGLPSDGPRLLHFEDTATHAHFAGEAADAYAYWKYPSAVSVLKEWRRELFFLKPGWLVVLDRIEKVNAGDPVTWHLNLLNEPTIYPISGGFSATAGSAQLYGTTVLPALSAPASVPVHEGPSGAQSSWRVDVTAPGGSEGVGFLHVLEVAGLGAEATPVTWSLAQQTLSFGPHTVAIDFAATGPTMMTLTTTAPPPPPPPIEPEPEPISVRVRTVTVTAEDGGVTVTYVPEEDPPQLRDDAPGRTCSVCGRKSVGAREGELCGMLQPNLERCHGRFI